MSWRIFGRIQLRENQGPIMGLIVRGWDKDLVRDDFLGEALTGEDGTYEIRYTTSDFSDYGLESAPDLYVRVHVPGSERVVATTEAFVRDDAGTNERFDFSLSCWDFLSSDPAHLANLRPVLHGMIRTTEGGSEGRRRLRGLRVALLGDGGGVLAVANVTEGAYALWVDDPPPTATVRLILPDGQTLVEYANLPLLPGVQDAQDFDIDTAVIEALGPAMAWQIL